jgi:hypothetical protein
MRASGRISEVSIDEVAQAVVAAARARSAALVAGDRRRLAALLHPRLRWTTYQGVVLDREDYLAGNVGGGLVWIEQTLQDIDVIGNAVAVLTPLVVDVVSRDGAQETVDADLGLFRRWLAMSVWACRAASGLSGQHCSARTAADSDVNGWATSGSTPAGTSNS